MPELLFDDQIDFLPTSNPPQSLARITPRDYQAAAIDKTFELFEQHRGVILRSPTGTGKTIQGALIADRWLQLDSMNRVVVVAHERQLIWQFSQEIEDVLGITPAIEMAERQARGNEPIIVASRQTLMEREINVPGGFEKISRLYKFRNDFNWLLIADECHRWARKLTTCKHIVEWFEENPNNRRLGLTATPERGDKVSLKSLFTGIASDYRLYDLNGGPCAVRDGWAVPYDQRFVTVTGVDFKELHTVAGDFRDDELERLLNTQEQLAKLCDPTLELVGNRRSLIFSPGVTMAKDVARYINAKLGWEAAKSLDGSVPDAVRQQTYKAHQRGDFLHLSICGLCREGYNDPNLGAVVIFRPTKIRSLAEQMKGRGCRPLRGLFDGTETREERIAKIAASAKPDCRIIDLVGVTGLADVASTAHLLGEGKPDEVIERANRNALDKQADDVPVDMVAEILNAEKELEDEKRAKEEEILRKKREAEEREKKRNERLEAERQAQKEADRRAKLKANVRYEQQKVAQGGPGGFVAHSGSGTGARMMFGRYKGERLCNIPDWYLRGCLNGKPEITKTWLKEAIQREVDFRNKQGLKVDGVEPAGNSRSMSYPQPLKPRQEQPATLQKPARRELTVDQINDLLAGFDV